jgi:hypothetical protein
MICVRLLRCYVYEKVTDYKKQVVSLEPMFLLAEDLHSKLKILQLFISQLRVPDLSR